MNKLTIFSLLILLHFKAYTQNNDCNDAFPLQNKNPFTIDSIVSKGSVADQVFENCVVCNSDIFQSNEDYSFWIKFKAITTGTFEFAATPLGLKADFDYVMYENCPCDPNKVKVACRWIGFVNLGPYVPTGISSDPMASFGIPNNLEFAPTITLQAGKTYFLLLNNITSQVDGTNKSGFSIQFGGTAQIGPPDDTEPGLKQTTLQGYDTVCINQTDVNYLTKVYSTTGNPLAYNWTIPSDATINGKKDSVLINFGTSPGMICVKANDFCYLPKTFCKDVKMSAVPDIALLDTVSCHNQQMDIRSLWIKDAANSLSVPSFHNTQKDAFDGTLPISNFTITNSQLISVRKTVNKACFDTASAFVTIQDIAFQSDSFKICGSSVNLDTLPKKEISNYGSANFTYSYFSDSLSAARNINKLNSSIVSNSGKYWRRANTKEGCFGLSSIFVELFQVPKIPAFNYLICDSCVVLDTLAMPSAGVPVTYQWFSNLTDAQANISPLTNRTICQNSTLGVRATAQSGCFDATTIPFSKYVSPTVSLSGNATICPNTPTNVELTFSFTGTAPFQVEFTDGKNVFTQSSTGTTLKINQSVSNQSSFLISGLKDATTGKCVSYVASGTATVSEFDTPKATNILTVCDSTRTEYVVTFDISGGAAGTYLVNGTPITGSSFSSPVVKSDSSFRFLIQDINKCIPDTVKGAISCKCDNSAGTMQLTDTLRLCPNDTAITLLSTNYILAAGDTISYILHDRPDKFKGKVLGLSPIPKFGFSPTTMQLDKVYFISAVTGDSINGFVDLKDPCLQVAPGRPVLFRKPDTLHWGLDTITCKGVALNVPVFSNQSNVEYAWTYNDGSQTLIGNTFVGSGTQTLAPTKTTTYTFWSAKNNFGCEVITGDSLTIVVPPDISVTNIKESCDATGENYTLTFDVAGSLPNSLKVNGGGGNLGGSMFTSTVFSTGDTYRYVVRGYLSCDSVVVQGKKICPCDTKPGTIDTSAITVCLYDTVQATLLLPGFKDGNDTALYVLSSDAAFTQILASNASGKFHLNSATGLNTNKDYFIAYLIGNKINTFPFIDLNKCNERSLSKKIRFAELPTVVSSALNSVCPGESVTVPLTFTGISNFNISVFSGNDTLKFVNKTLKDSVQITVNQANVYSIRVTDGLGCVNTNANVFSTSIKKLSVPNKLTQDTITVCQKDIIRFTHSGFTVEKGDTLLYEIAQQNGIVISLVNSLTINYNGTAFSPNTFYKITPVIAPKLGNQPNLSSSCAVRGQSSLFRFLEQPTARLSIQPTVCSGDSVTLKLTLQKYPFTGDIFSIQYRQDGKLTTKSFLNENATFKVSVGKDPLFQLVSIANQGISPICTPDADTTPFRVQTVFPPVASLATEVCNKNKLNYVVTLDVFSSTPATVKVTGVNGGLWNGTQFVSNPINSNSTYSFTITDGNNCKEVVISGIKDCSCPKNVGADITLEKSISCNNAADAKLSAKPTGNIIAPYSFLWSTGNKESFIDKRPAGLYVVTITGADDCGYVDSFIVTSPERITATLKEVNPKCPEARTGTIFVEDIKGGTPPYYFKFENQQFGTSTEYGNLFEGQYDITIRDVNNCEVKYRAELEDPAPFKISLGLDATIAYGDSIQLAPTFNDTIVRFSWSPSIFCQDSIMCLTPWVRPTEHFTIYTLTAYNKNGCSAVSTVTINTKQYKDVYIPSAFNPDGSDQNKYLTVFAAQNVETVISLRVFDRWGNLLFENYNFKPNDLSSGWDGTFNGNVMSNGVYVYACEVLFSDGSKKIIQGDTTLMR